MPDLSLTKVWAYQAATTFERLAPFISDNATGRIFLLHALDENGMKQRVNGGLQLIFPVFKELPTAQAYSDMDALSTTRANPTTVARYNWKQVAAPVTISGRDMIINSGSDLAQTQILKHFVEAAEAAVREALDDSTTGIHSTNDESSAGITGLQNLLTHTSNATPTSGTAGALDRSTHTYWRNQVSDVANDFSANGYFRMHDLYTLCGRGDETPDIVELTRAAYLNYIRNSTPTSDIAGSGTFNFPQTASKTTLNVGHSAVTFLGARMGYDDYVPADTGYFINSKYAHWVVHPQRDLELGPFVKPAGQDALMAQIFWAGNLCFSNMARHGVLRRGDTN